MVDPHAPLQEISTRLEDLTSYWTTFFFFFLKSLMKLHIYRDLKFN